LILDFPAAGRIRVAVFGFAERGCCVAKYENQYERTERDSWKHN
jgi:hypothetical protein